MSSRIIPVQPFDYVVFGATGDLTKRKLVPSLMGLAKDGLLPPGFALDGDVVGAQMTAHGGFVEGREGDADVVDIATARDGRDGARGAGMGDVPEDDQGGAAPDLLHAQRGVGITGLAAEHVGIPAHGLIEIVDEEDDMVEAEDLEIATELMTPYAHWITPTFVPKRFDTWFFLAEAPEDQIALHDGSESTDSVWIGPQEAIEEAKAGKRTLVHATTKNLELLAEGKGPLPDGFFWAVSVLLLAITALLGMLIYFLQLLWRIIGSVGEGDPFVPENAGRLSRIGIAIAAMELLRLAVVVFVSAVPKLVGDEAPRLSTQFILWISVAALFVLSQVFREGTRLRDEEKMTI